MLKGIIRKLQTAPVQEVDVQGRIQLAAAVLLLEVAFADGELHDKELELIRELLIGQFKITSTDLDELLTEAGEVRRDSSDLHQFTREINIAFSQAEKEQIIEAIWRLVYADGRLDHFEEALMRQLGSLIGLSHRKLIAAKLRVSKP